MATFKLDRSTLIPGSRVEHTASTYEGKSITAASTLTQRLNIVGKNK